MINLQKNNRKPNQLNTNKEWSDYVVELNRVTKVCKGGKKLSFRAVVVVGNKMGHVGVGVGKASEPPKAIDKGYADAKRNLIFIELTKNNTITHLTYGKFGSAKTLLKPACEGTGVIAGSSTRTILELAGIKNILTKQLGSRNKLNNARSTICALTNIKNPIKVAHDRGIALEKLS
jgi:small subunit ribosomal protein S5